MKCRGCGYRLWGIRARVCPECGKPFRVSERRFVPGKAVFGCPTCGARYVGTGEEGLPEPREFACAGCETWLTVDDLVVSRAPGARGRVEIEPISWHARGRLGFWRSWVRTVREVWSSPVGAARSVPARGGWDDPLWFGMATWVLASLLGLWGVVGIIAACVGLAAMASIPGASGGVFVFVAIAGLFGVFVTVALVWAGLALSGLVVHGVLALTGRTRHGVRGTMEAVGYSSAAALLAAPPCLGFWTLPFAFLLQCVFAGVMLCVRQGVSWWRAAAAVAPLGLALFVVAGGPGVAQVRGLMGASHRARMQMSTTVTGHEVVRAMSGLEWFEVQHGAPAGHGVELIAHGSIRPEEFVGAQLRQGTGQIRVGLSASASRELMKRWEAQRAAMPSGVVAHRMGQFVFVHHGVSAAHASAGVWMVIAAPMPVSEDVLGTMSSPGTGVFDGRFLVITQSQRGWKEIAAVDTANELAAQNALRVKEGLAPIPDPFTVLEGSPVVAGGTGSGGGGSSP